MQLGYSLLLREYVAATDVDYGDCKEFQITCPACHEAIFKAGKFDQERQYFSHYAASQSDVQQCELRVATVARESIEAKNILGHGQSLDQFFAHFRGFVMRWLYGSRAVQMQRRVNWMATRPGFMRYADGIGKLARMTRGDSDEARGWQNAVFKSLKQHRSQFWMTRQADFAADFMDHLLAPNSGSLLTYAVGVAVLLSPINLEFQQIMTEAKEKVLVRTLDFVSDQSMEFQAYNNLVLRALSLMLMIIPYLDMLAEHANNKKDRNLLLELTIDYCNELRDPDNYVPLSLESFD